MAFLLLSLMGKGLRAENARPAELKLCDQRLARL